MAKRLTKDEWIAARLAWESDPLMTGAQLAEAVGISRQSINEKMKRDETRGDPWEKKVSRMEMAERAMAAADKRSRTPPAPALDDPAATDEIPPVRSEPDVSGNPDNPVRKDESLTGREPKKVSPEAAARLDPVAARAEVIGRHRKEWAVSRGLVGEAVGKRDFDKAKLAKITSETLKIIQDGERKAWGLDATDPADKTVVVIERSGAGGK